MLREIDRARQEERDAMIGEGGEIEAVDGSLDRRRAGSGADPRRRRHWRRLPLEQAPGGCREGRTRGQVGRAAGGDGEGEDGLGRRREAGRPRGGAYPLCLSDPRAARLAGGAARRVHRPRQRFRRADPPRPGAHRAARRRALAGHHQELGAVGGTELGQGGVRLARGPVPRPAADPCHAGGELGPPGSGAVADPADERAGMGIVSSTRRSMSPTGSPSWGTRPSLVSGRS